MPNTIVNWTFLKTLLEFFKKRKWDSFDIDIFLLALEHLWETLAPPKANIRSAGIYLHLCDIFEKTRCSTMTLSSLGCSVHQGYKAFCVPTQDTAMSWTLGRVLPSVQGHNWGILSSNPEFEPSWNVTTCAGPLEHNASKLVQERWNWMVQEKMNGSGVNE